MAKAYARAPVLTVNGSDDGFDGFRIGLAGFENPMRDSKTEEAKRQIGKIFRNWPDWYAFLIFSCISHNLS